MNRGQPPQRKSPLPRGKGLQRRGALQRQAGKTRQADAAAKPKKPAKAQDIPKAVRDAVIARDGGLCCRCGADTTGRPRSVHHRIPRGMGGSQDPHTLPNLLLLCGTGTTGCHGYIESERDWARDHGFLVRRRHDPASRPVLRHGRAWQTPTDSGWVDCDPPADYTTTEENAA